MIRKVLLNATPADSLTYDELKTEFAKKDFDLVVTRFEKKEMEKIIAAAKDCQAVVSNGEKWDAQAIDAVKDHIHIFVQHGVGVNSLDVAHMTECGIPVYNVAGANAQEVAEVALFLMLGVMRKMGFSMEKAKQGCAGDTGLFFGHSLEGKTVGLAGAGFIARRLAQMLQCFGAELLAYDPYVSPELVAPYGIELVDSLEEVFVRSHVVSLHLPLTAETQGCVHKRLFDRMKPGAYLVNTSRGGIVNEPDLIEALGSGQLAGAGLDVVVHEPVSPNDPLYGLENVMITPHIGANSYESIVKYTCVITKALDSYFKGNPEANVLNPGYRKA